MCELKTKIKWKTIKNDETFTPSKNFIFFVRMYKMDTFALFTAKAWIKNGVEVI